MPPRKQEFKAKQVKEHGGKNSFHALDFRSLKFIIDTIAQNKQFCKSEKF